jgi:hypothetical protein
MVKNLALTASIVALVAISGQAFARTTGSNTRYSPTVVDSPDQRVPIYNADDAYSDDAFNNPMATQIAEPDAHRYHGGPKSND